MVFLFNDDGDHGDVVSGAVEAVLTPTTNEAFLQS